jgi:hypothetical protein
MQFKSDSFLDESQNPLYDWDHVGTTLGIIAHASSSARENGLKTVEEKGFVWFDERNGVVRAVCQSSSRSLTHLVLIDYNDNQMTCECEAFTYNDGPCKHIVAVASRALSNLEGSEDDNMAAKDWIELAVEESRNTQSGRRAWEKEPSFEPGLARKHDAEVVEVEKGRRTVQGYKLQDSTIWTGPLPVPVEDDKITVCLPTGEKVPARVMEQIQTSSDYKALKVKLGRTPSHFDKKILRVYGREVFRNDSQMIEQEQSDETRRNDRESRTRSRSQNSGRSRKAESSSGGRRRRRGRRRNTSGRSRRDRK